MNASLGIPTLVPYLRPTDTKFYLKMSMIGQADSDHKRLRFPFLVLSSSDPLAFLLEAAVLSDAGTIIQNAFLLTQKDEYHLAKDEIWPVNNRDIDHAWQEFFTFLNDQNHSDPIIILKDQVGDDGKLLPWAPLFFCHHRQVFFQPPCPRCGSALEMSRDDDLLTRSGLQPYSTTLKRYLFCPQCLEARGESDFYVRSHAKSDPLILQDLSALISGFGQLARNENRNANIPCMECDSLQQCYDTDQLSITRITSFSFYPFYMIALPAPSIHFLDFLFLLAGAEISDLASRHQNEGRQGRLQYLTTFGRITSQKTRFLFDKDEKFFLEVLYLKLSLLGEMAQLVFSGLKTFKYPDLGMSINRIWADVTEQSGLLPVFWNFKLRLLGFGIDSAKAPFLSKLPPSYGLYFLGAIWFYVLLVNKKQDISKIHAEISGVIEHYDSENAAGFENVLQNQPSVAFAPENVFWDPDQRMIKKDWEPWWARSLDLGFLLLKHGMSEKSQWIEAEFWQKFETLRDTLKETLFGPEASLAGTSPAEGDEVIHEILLKIKSKWHDDFLTEPSATDVGADTFPAEAPSIAKSDAGAIEDSVTEETVIISPDDFKAEEPTVIIPADKLEETILLKPEDVKSPEAPAPASKTTKDLPETVILTHEVSETEKPVPGESQESDIPETVIISSKKPVTSQIDSDHKRTAGGAGSQPTKKSISKESKARQAEKKTPDKKDEIDDLPETVIIDSKKPQGRKKDHG